MHISIWRQFSSNNSANFVVVGEFQTPQQAQEANEEILHLLRGIAEWYERPENDAIRRKIGPPNRLDTPLTPIEESYRTKYDIEWGDPIDWAIISSDIHEAVEIVDHLLIVSNIPLRYSTLSCHPINVLLERLGAHAWCDFDWGEHAKVSVMSVTADEATLTRIHQLIKDDVIIDSESNTRIHVDKVERKGEQLFFYGVSLIALADLANYLKKQGFHDIQYAFEQVT